MRKVYIILRIKINRLIKIRTYKTLSKNKINFIINFNLNIKVDSLNINFISKEDFEINKNKKRNNILTVKP